MKKIFFTVVLLLFGHVFAVFAQNDSVFVVTDTIYAQDLLQQIDADAELEKLLLKKMHEQSLQLARKQDSIHNLRLQTDLTTLQPFHIGYADSLKMQQNIKQMHGVHPLAIELVFKPLAQNFTWKYLSFGKLYYGKEALQVPQEPLKTLSFTTDTILLNLRNGALSYINTHAAHLYATNVYKLPNVSHIVSQEYLKIEGLGKISIDKTSFDEYTQEQRRKLREIKAQYSNWNKDANVLLLVSQNYISPNWYKGGNSSFAIAGILKGEIKYDNKKNIKWENNAEWRAGVHNVTADTLHKISVNDDIFRLYTKFGVKAVKNIYYAASAEFRTQFFNTYKGINSDTITTTFFTPLRFNVDLGLDYNPNKNLSIVVSPLSYKFVYVHDTIHVEQKNFGVPTGQNQLHELGSSVRIEWVYKPIREVNLVSKFYFYTNYKKVEIDWEVTCDFIATRYITTRIMLHPRYDNTAITKDDEKAKIQFKELISVGLSYKF